MTAAAILSLDAITKYAAEVFVAGLWQGAVMAAMAAMSLAMLPRASSAVRFGIWAAAFATALALPLMHFTTAGSGEAGGSVLHLAAGWGEALGAIWAALMIYRAVQLALEGLRLRRIWLRAQPVADVEPELEGLLREGGRGAELCASSDVDSPSVVGFRSPRLLIPEALLGALTPAELGQIVLHEREHLRRRDDWLNLLQKIGLVLFPLNPALLWMDRRLSLERELACDAGVVRATSAPIEYASCLARIAEHRTGRRVVALAMAALDRRSQLGRRVDSLLRKREAMSRAHAGAAMAMLSLGLVGGSIEMARAPRLVSFATANAAPAVEHAAFDRIPIGATPVLYQDRKAARATLLEAVLPIGTPRHPVRSLRSKSGQGRAGRQARLADLRGAQRRDATGAGKLVLTSAKQMGVPPQPYQRRPDDGFVLPAAAFTTTDFAPSYAAVPFGNGWLIVQL